MKRRRPVPTILYDDPDIPLMDCDDQAIGELTQSFAEASQVFQRLPFLNQEGSDFENLPGPSFGEPSVIRENRPLKTDNILYDDPDIPFMDCDDQIIGELTQGFAEASQVFQRLPLYYQVGSGFENQPGPSSAGQVLRENRPHMSDDLGDAIIIQERSRRTNKKYNAEEVGFRINLDVDRLPQTLRENSLLAAAESVRQIFHRFIQMITQNLRSTDLIRICIHSLELDKPISTTFMSVEVLSVEKLMSAVLKVVQSKDEIKLDAGFSIDVMIIKRDVGGGQNRGIINIDLCRITKQSILTVPYDDFGLCCSKSIVYALAHLNNDRTAINALKDKRRPALMKRARALHEAAGVPVGPCTYQDIAIFEEYLDVQIVVISSDHFHRVSYKGQKRSKRINLWLHNGHFEVIKSLKGFYGRNYYCETCEKPYDHLENHFCPAACPVCLSSECIEGESQRCADCDRLCRSEECFVLHKSRQGNAVHSLCDTVYQCRKCSKVIKRRNCSKDLHRCGTVQCTSCKKYIDLTNHLCHVKRVPPKPSSDKIIFFDFETDQTTGEHLVNFAVAQYANGEENVFKGYSACEEFCSWLFTSKHKGYTAIAHNMQGFDGQFILAYLLSQGVAPEVIPNGSKLMSINFTKLSIRIIDSFNFIPMGLGKLPSCFGFKELKKGYFPHLFNTRENQSYVGSIPDSCFYSPDTMSEAGRTAFLLWYEENKGNPFNFQEEMMAYCRSDVDILRRCCMEFRKEFLDVSGVDPFRYITIASACMAIYRSSHIPADSIAMIPANGYVNGTKYSPDSIRWLDFLAETEGINICHALNNRGEVKLAGISVDGFCKETNTIYQYQGCFFHGCPECYDGDCVNPLTGFTMSILNKKTRELTERLRLLGFEVIEKWEHDFVKEKKENSVLKSFLLKHVVEDRLNPRDAFFGGRTNAIKLYFEGTAKYVDFTSLYPWVNKYCRYPKGHPDIITENFETLDNYFGIIKCQVVPPRGLYFPVLPYRNNGKLLFPLCRKCTENMQQVPCEHNDEERTLKGTWVTEELKKAVEKGYKITNIFEVYHFKESSVSLFKSYIDLFLKLKQESSGWPSNCSSPEDREKYVQDYEEREGVKLNATSIKKNPGRRQVAKLALNSFWGRWGMNRDKSQLTYVHTLEKFNSILADPKKNISDIYLPTAEIAAIQWKSHKDFMSQDADTNIFIAAFTTAWARLKLYSELERLGACVLYHDTDSIIYESNGINDPPLGNFLGEFTNELDDGDAIATFVSGGPKNYAYLTTSGTSCCKVRGFTLNFCNSQLVNFSVLKNLVKNMDDASVIPVVNPSKITREVKRRRVINKPETKSYRLVYDKRVIKEDYSTIPYGY